MDFQDSSTASPMSTNLFECPTEAVTRFISVQSLKLWFLLALSLADWVRTSMRPLPGGKQGVAKKFSKEFFADLLASRLVELRVLGSAALEFKEVREAGQGEGGVP